jgi:hypothetical protein
LESHYCILRWIKWIGGNLFFFSQMGNTNSGKPRKSLENPRFLGIPRKFLSLYKLWLHM